MYYPFFLVLKYFITHFSKIILMYPQGHNTQSDDDLLYKNAYLTFEIVFYSPEWSFFKIFFPYFFEKKFRKTYFQGNGRRLYLTGYIRLMYIFYIEQSCRNVREKSFKDGKLLFITPWFVRFLSVMEFESFVSII